MSSTSQSAATFEKLFPDELRGGESGSLRLLDDPQEWDSFGKPVAFANSRTDEAVQPLMWESHFVLSGMYCPTCALTIEDALRAARGIEKVEVSAAARRARVQWRPSQILPSEILQIVKKAGYAALPAKDCALREVNQALQRKALWRWLLATFCMMQVMMYAWPAYEARVGDLSVEMERLLRWASWVICIPMLIFACGPFFASAWQDLKSRRVSMDLPVALGIALTFVISTLGTIQPDGMFGREVFYDSLSMFVCFLLTGRWLEMRLRNRTAGALDEVMNRLPDSVERRTTDGCFERIALRKIAVGDVVRVFPGDAFPADGKILKGHTQADESLLTGESKPITRVDGDCVVAGSYNLDAAVEVLVEKVGEQTKYAQILELMEHAAIQKPRLAQLADKIAAPFLGTVLLLAFGSAIYWWPQDPGHALMVAAAVLIVTCPCALSLATPVAMLTAAGTLARQGVLVRNLQAVEVLASVDTLFFDKTGTLTCDGIEVCSSLAKDGSIAKWQALAAKIAHHSKHPVSKALAACSTEGAEEWEVLQTEEIRGKGVRAQVRDSHDAQSLPMWLRLGSHRFAAVGETQPTVQTVYLAKEVGESLQVLAAFGLSERVRSDAGEAIRALRMAGIDVQMLSGDTDAPVEKVATALSLTEVFAQCTPERKVHVMREAQQEGHVIAMVGDGLNDAPVLAGADVSFAFGRSVALTQSHSDFVVMGEHLMAVSQAICFARKTMSVVRQNLFWALSYNLISVPFAMMGAMPAWLAGLGMALSSLLVIVNAARLVKL